MNLQPMKLKIAFALALSLFSGAANAEKIALVNETLINPATSQIVRDATIVIDGDRIAAAGDAKTVTAPKDRTSSIARVNSFCPGISTRTFTSFNRATCSRGRTVRI